MGHNQEAISHHQSSQNTGNELMMIASLLLLIVSISSIHTSIQVQALQWQNDPLAFSSVPQFHLRRPTVLPSVLLPGIVGPRSRSLRSSCTSTSIYGSPHTEEEEIIPPSPLTPPVPKRSPPLAGQMKQRIYQSTGRESRISALELQQRNDPQSWTDAKQAELNGILRVSSTFEEPYDETSFGDDHVDFKRLHNEAFLALIRYCEERRKEKVHVQIGVEEEARDSVRAFFLDGPTGGTASVLIQGGLDPSQCFVANRHESTCHKLRISGGGTLPEENVVHATAAEALRRVDGAGDDGEKTNNDDDDDEGTNNGPLAHLEFAAYYFDGCGGYVPHIVDMVSAALIRTRQQKGDELKTTAIGFSLMGGNKNVVDKELTICQAVNKIAKQQNMRMGHVLDDPDRYGISSDIRKIGGAEGQTFTTWLILEMDH
jgi:hypothetical protein